MNSTFTFYLRCYIVGSELRGHQVPLINFGKAKVTQLHGCILRNGQKQLLLSKKILFL